jgi:CYTH domain-containing protein
MHHEIERKFLVKKMPKLENLVKVSQERYFIQRSDLLEEGMKRKGDIFEYERKSTLSPKEKTREVTIITEDEFTRCKKDGTSIIERDSYSLSKEKPIISIKVYKGIYRGLTLVEIEFDSIDEMEAFIPLRWMGKEVTDTPLGKDARLIDLDREHFKDLFDILSGRRTLE